MPTARASAAAVVKNNIIYVIGGWNNTRVSNVESYDPATDTWTEETPLLSGQSNLIGGLIGSWIVVADGFTDHGDTGDIEGLNPLTNAWRNGTPDPALRDWACGGTIGAELYVAGGYYGPALTVTDSFNAVSNTWTRLADIPQTTLGAGSSVYRGKLYCFGGSSTDGGALLNNVQIYQP
jgi:N-acetylneuraminic acid mutarotase